MRLATDLAEERRDRIRSEERAEMAAHLHDSVLQTFAMIQSTDDPTQDGDPGTLPGAGVAGLAVRQPQSEHGRMLSDALEEMADRVEQASDVPVEVVVVSDLAMGPKLEAVVAASGEAMTNAARHSGAGKVSVYAEVDGAMLEVFVTDQGVGFDSTALPADRHGLA